MNFADRDGWIWFDGELIPWREAKIHVLTHTLHYGLGVFEGIRAYQTDKGVAVFRLAEHIDRLFDSAKILRLSMPYSKAEILSASEEVIRQNKLQSAYIRPMAFLGSEGMGLRADNLKTHVFIAAWQWGTYLGEGVLEKGIRVKTSSIMRNHVNSIFAKAKANGHYVNSMMALQEALSCGYDEALMLDHLGFVAEGSGENFFMVKDGVVYTPPLMSILAGITRASVIDLLKAMHIPVVETNITRDQVYTADEAFFTGTAAEITPICNLDNCVIGQGKRGPLTFELQKNYFDCVYGRHPLHEGWLTYVK